MKRKPKLHVVPNDPMPEAPTVTRIGSRKINDDIVAQSKLMGKKRESAFNLPSFPPIALPKGGKRTQPMAQDQQIIEVNAWAVQNTYNGAFTNGATFLGYPYLAELSQIPEYRKITETIAMHMTRKFIKFKSVGDGEDGEADSKTDKIKKLTDAIENFKLRDVFRKAAEVDGYFGRAHLYVDLGYADPKEMRMPIGNGRDALSRIKVPMGKLKGFKIIEPVWTYPSNYNSNNPFTEEWYNPQSWFVLGKEIHHSRCMRMVGREVADLLKPSYAFGGLSLSQIAKPYIDNWLRTRQSVADVVWSFSTSGVMTDLQTLMQGQGADLFARAELYNNLRNNRGLMLLNKDSEEFFQINTPLGTLDKLQAQAQEHMASVSSIPLVFLLGITPSGLNASSEGEIRVFYDFIHAFQTKFFTEPLTRCIDFIQLSLFGEVDPEITFEFEPLWSMDEKSLAEIDKTKAETADLRINGGVVSPLEERKAVASDTNSPYQNLDTTVIPVPPGGGDPNDPEDDPEEPLGGKGLDPGKPEGGDDEHPRIGGGSDDDDSPFANDAAEWSENDHKRGQPGNAGQFGSGGGGGESKPKVVEHYGSYAIEHNGEHVKNKLGNRKLFSSPEAAQKFADTYTGAEPEGGTKEKPKPLPSKSTISKGDKFKTVSTIQEYLDIAKKSERDLSAKDKEVIAHYTSPEYAALNKQLRGDTPLNSGTQKIVDRLDRIISESVLSEPVSLFRGLKGSKVRAQLDAMLPGDMMTDPGFVSTSMAKHVAGAQAHGAKDKATMIIRAPAGANAAFPGEHSYNAVPGAEGKKVDNAMEAILPRGSQFKLIGKHGATYEVELVPPKQAQDDAHWEEGKHPRKDNGQFGSGSGGSTANHADIVKKATAKPAGISGKYRQGLQDILKMPGLSAEHATAIKHKIIESYVAKHTQLTSPAHITKEAEEKAKSIQNKIKKLMSSLGHSGPVTVPIKSEEDKGKETDAQAHQILKNAGLLSSYEVDKSHAQPDKFILKNKDGHVLGNNGEFGQGIPTKKFDTKEAAEQAGKDHDANKEKQAEANAKAAEALKEAQKASAATNKEYMDALGITETEANGFHALTSMHGDGGTADLVKKFKSYENQAKKLSYPISGFEYALIRDYINGGYHQINDALRGKSLTPQQHVYTRMMNKAMDKLPKFEGTVQRGTNLSAEQIAHYKPGHIVEEKSFTSTGVGFKFSGNVEYKIKAIGKRGADFSKGANQGEKEVLFKAHTFFLVHKVEHKNGKTHIEMEEVEGHG